MSNKQKRVFWPSLAIVVLLLITLGFVAARSISTFARASTVTTASLSADQSDIQGLVVALRPTGFVPAEIEVTDGRYFFIVQNRCGIRDLTFRLDRDKGERLHEVHDQKPQWRKEFNLHPGTYVLSVVDHPDWRFLIKVKPR